MMVTPSLLAWPRIQDISTDKVLFCQKAYRPFLSISLIKYKGLLLSSIYDQFFFRSHLIEYCWLSFPRTRQRLLHIKTKELERERESTYQDATRQTATFIFKQWVFCTELKRGKSRQKYVRVYVSRFNSHNNSNEKDNKWAKAVHKDAKQRIKERNKYVDADRAGWDNAVAGLQIMISCPRGGGAHTPKCSLNHHHHHHHHHPRPHHCSFHLRIVIISDGFSERGAG